jgi:hypothetical protein
MPNIFMPPAATHRVHPAVWVLSSPNKRKKQKHAAETAHNKVADVSENAERELKANDEYAAVIAPEGRDAHHLAGQRLVQAPPQFPFPHAGEPSTAEGAKTHNLLSGKREAKTSIAPEMSQSLHIQHLTALTTIIHRSLLQEDYSRASRALGLLFRRDVAGENAAVRNQGFMGIAAEVLLRNGHSTPLHSASAHPSLPFTHEGFERAKRFYERLIVRYPYHKSWPNAVNAVDFYLAMFNLWIYVVHAENAIHPERNEDTENPALARQTLRELEQANQIADKLDACMATVPFMDEPEFIRLRSMAAFWIADLHHECALLFRHNHQVGDMLLGQDGVAILLEGEQRERFDEHEREATLGRVKARELLSKLEGRATSDDDLDA